MTKSISSLTKIAVCGLLVLSTTTTADAGLIPWTYNAIFGPVGSTFAARPAYGYTANYGAYNAGACCGNSYTAGYTPYYAGYSGYTTNYYAAYPTTSYYGFSNDCSTCGTCNTCNYGCATNCCTTGCNGCANCVGGNCCSGLTSATGTTTPAPATNQSPTPTTTFKSTEPTLNKDNNTNTDSSNYDESNNSGGFEMPERNGTDAAPRSDAPPFNFDSSSSRESLKIPAPVEQIPAESGTDALRAPRLDLIPAPVAIDETDLSWSVTSTPTRVSRSARFSVPTVARYSPSQMNDLLPPLPVQVAGK